MLSKLGLSDLLDLFKGAKIQVYVTTVELLSKGHFGASCFVPCREAVLISEVENVLTPYISTLLVIWKVSFVERLSLSRTVL